MFFTKWYNGLLKKMKWYDISLTKLSTAAFTLLIAKYYPPILSADWTIYAAIALISAAIVWYHVFKK